MPLGTFKKETETFYKILNDEIIPFVNANYPTSGFNVLIGHSNSAHFVTQPFLEDNINFRGIIAFSVSDYGREYFQEKLPEKLNQEKSKILFFGYGTKDDEFNKLGQYLKKQNLSNQNLLVKSYNADHIL